MKYTTTHLQMPRRAWYDLPTPVMVALCLAILFGIVTAVHLYRLIADWHTEPATTPLPIVIIASPLPQGIPPTAVPLATPAAVAAAFPPNALRGAVVAYDSPNGNVLGAIEAGRTYAILARYGSDWLQADVDGSGVVWLRSADVLDLPAGLADLQPTTAPVVVERPIYVSAPAPEQAAPTPPPAAPEMPLQQAAILDRGAWASQAATAQAQR